MYSVLTNLRWKNGSPHSSSYIIPYVDSPSLVFSRAEWHIDIFLTNFQTLNLEKKNSQNASQDNQLYCTASRRFLQQSDLLSKCRFRRQFWIRVSQQQTIQHLSRSFNNRFCWSHSSIDNGRLPSSSLLFQDVDALLRRQSRWSTRIPGQAGGFRLQHPRRFGCSNRGATDFRFDAQFRRRCHGEPSQIIRRTLGWRQGLHEYLRQARLEAEGE